MDLEEKNEFRRVRLAAAVERLGSATELGRSLGYKDGAFVRQMLVGHRPVSEKTAAAIEAIEGMRNWFTPPPTEDEPLVLSPEERAWVLAHRAAIARGPNPYALPDDGKEGFRKNKVAAAAKQRKGTAT